MSKTRYTYIKHNGTWKQPKNVLIKQSGAWTQCKGIYTKVQGEWVLVWPSQVAVMTISTDLVQINSSLNTTSDTQKVIITNSGDADLRITDITPSTPTKFTINIDATGLGGTPSIGTPRTIAPGTSKSFEISITSALLDGTDSGTVTITAFNNVLNATTTQDVTVSGTIDVLDASVRVDKSSVSLTTGVTKKSSAAKITVTNNGTDNLNITSLTTTGVPSLFTIEFNTTGLGGAPSVGTPRTIAPGSSKSFEVTITGGNSPGSDSGVVTLGYLINQLGDSDTTTINVNGSVSLSTAILTPSPEALSFGSVTVNTETRKSLVLKNTGSDVLTVNSISATNPSFITLDQKSVAAGGIGPTLPTTIDAGKSKTIDVIVNASTAGASSGTITIGYTKDILGTTASTTVAVTATGVNLITGFYEITPSPINVTVKNGAQVALPIIKILNKGQTAINNTTLTFTKPSQWVYSGASGVAGQGPLTNPLGSGVAYELEVFVTGAAVGTGSGSITFTGTATGGGTVTGQCVINVTVEASAFKEPPVVVEALPIVWFNDDPDKDGNPYLEFTSNDEQSRNIILKNTGTAPVTVIKITDDQGGTGSPSAEWFLKADNLPATIAAGSTASFNITKKAFTPLTSLSRTLRFTFQEQTTNVNNKYTHPSILKDVSIVLQEGPPPSGTIDLVAPAGFATNGGAYVASWTVPSGVTKVRAILLGGGAGGAAGLEGDPWVNGGGGGGAGEYLATTVDVTPGQQISYKIGAGGQGAVASYGGQPSKPYASRGGNTEFNGLIAQGGYPPTAGTYGGNRRPIGGLGGSTNAGLGINGQDGAAARSSTSTLDAVVMRGGAGASLNLVVTGGTITGTGGAAGAGGEIDWYLNGAASDSYGAFAKQHGIWLGLSPTENTNSWSKSISFTTTTTGTYTIEYVMDNSGAISIQEDGVAGDKINFSDGGIWKGLPAKQTVKLVGGKTHDLTFDIKNTGGPGIIGIQVTDPAAFPVWSTRELANGRTTPQGPGYTKGAKNGGNATGFGAGGGGGNGRSMGSDDYVHGSGGNGAPGMIRLIWPPS